MIVNESTLPLQMPPSERPTLVDTFEPFAAMQIAAMHAAEESGRYQDAHGFEMELAAAIAANGVWFNLANDIRREAIEHDVEYLLVRPNERTPSCEPGSNRYLLYPEHLPREYHYSLLDQYAPELDYPHSITARDELAKSDTNRTAPYVLKDTIINRGVGKLLVEPDAHDKVLEFLGTLPEQMLGHVVLEDFVESPSRFATSYRVTATPTGYLQAATMMRSLAPAAHESVETDEVSLAWRPLVTKGGPLYLNARRIVSNGNETSVNIPLSTERYSIRPNVVPLSDEDGEALEAHGINPNDPKVPDHIVEAGIAAAKTLGPTLGLQVGIDLIEDNAGKPWFIEANNNPSCGNIIQGWGGLWGEEFVRLDAARRLMFDLKQQQA